MNRVLQGISLRVIETVVRRAPAPLRGRAKALLAKGAGLVRRHGRLATAIDKVLDHAPGLKARIQVELASPASSPAPEIPADDPRLLAPHARQIHGQLRAAVARRRAAPGPEGLSTTAVSPERRARLAFVSPLPPERTGIADYSAELLPALAQHYDIDLVLAQARVEPSLGQFGQLRDVGWLRTHADEIDRVLYHVGNSEFHGHMLELMRDVPGIVVLHDFFLSGLLFWAEDQGGLAGVCDEAMLHAHGYHAVRDRYRDLQAAVRDYPVNLSVLQQAEGVIVHSRYSRDLVQRWYGDGFGAAIEVIPMLREPAGDMDRLDARRRLGIDPRDFLVCSFGFVGWTKLNHRLLDSWLSSALAADERCRLSFVGGNPGGDYGERMVNAIGASGRADRIAITGFASPQLFRDYLAAADVAVQLRTCARGETSAAVLDCLNHGLPLIANANGSMAELDPEAALVLPDAFEDAALRGALETLWRDPERRAALGTRGRVLVRTRHAPAEIARCYADTIERFHRRALRGWHGRVREAASSLTATASETELVELAQTLAEEHPAPGMPPRLLLDVTATCSHDLRTGIERVARALVVELLESPPAGYRVEPVYLCQAGGQWHHRHARRFTLGLMGCPQDRLPDVRLIPARGDILLTLDHSGHALIEAWNAGWFQRLREQGTQLHALVFDLLPLRMPQVFPPGGDEGFGKWLDVVSRFDGAIGISRATSEDLAVERAQRAPGEGERPYRVGWFHLGADIERSAPSRGLPGDAKSVLRQLRARPSFLMVGTIEPRKGHLEVLETFQRLWRDGVDVNLVVVGHEGWRSEPQEQRRNIPQTVARLKEHRERNHRLFWLNGISDQYLEQVYAACSCLVFASYGEGFGLPLVEAAQRKLPIIARDLPVFREVAGEHALYFDGSEGQDLATVVTRWLQLWREGQHPRSEHIRWLTWRESAASLLRALDLPQAS